MIYGRALALVFFALSSVMPSHAANQRPQYVLISFDGAGPIEQWQRSAKLAEISGARFTYFLSCVFLLTRETRNAYHAPGFSGPRSNVGYAASDADIEARLQEIIKARSDGHEIANHTCGHLDGGKWTEAEWLQELKQFKNILQNTYEINKIKDEPEFWKDFVQNEIIGFRAPYLAHTPKLFSALSKAGYHYDASTVSQGPSIPLKSAGLTQFSLPMIPEGPSSRPVIAMDYNFYARQSGAKENIERAAEYEDRTYQAFMKAFHKEYGGARTPLQLGFHFTMMNGGAYWRALERFASEVCEVEQVKCVTYQQYLHETDVK